jgi:hypothetical protein
MPQPPSGRQAFGRFGYRDHSPGSLAQDHQVKEHSLFGMALLPSCLGLAGWNGQGLLQPGNGLATGSRTWTPNCRC